MRHTHGPGRPGLLADTLAGDGVPPQADTERVDRESAYNLLSGIIGHYAARVWHATDGAERAELERAERRHLDDDARLAFLTAERCREVLDTAPAVLRRLRAEREPADAAATTGLVELGEAELRGIFDRALRDRLTGEPREQPRVLLLGGQPGSGKSTVQRRLVPALPAGVVSYDGDDLMRLAPDYEPLMLADDVAGSEATAAQVRGLHRMALSWVRERRCDVVCSHPLGRADWAMEWVSGFRAAGYRVEVAFLAVHSAHSARSLDERYALARRHQGFGRWMPPIYHERYYAGVPNTVEFLETHRLVDSLYVLTRTGGVLYDNHLDDDGDWHFATGARRVLAAARERDAADENPLP